MLFFLCVTWFHIIFDELFFGMELYFYNMSKFDNDTCLVYNINEILRKMLKITSKEI